MDRRIEKTTPRPGDRIIFAKAANTYDVILITPSAQEETLRSCSTLDMAYEVARGGVSGGRLWWRESLVADRDRAVRRVNEDLKRAAYLSLSMTFPLASRVSVRPSAAIGLRLFSAQA